MADTDEFDKGTLRNATRGIPEIGTTNERDAAGAAKDAISEGRRLVAEQRFGEKARGAEAFIGEKVQGAEAKYQDWRAQQAQNATTDRERRKAEAQEKTEKYRDDLETKRAETEIKVLEAQARSYQPQDGNVAQLRDAMLNMKAEGQKMFSGPVSNAMRNAPNPLEGGQMPSPLMMTIMTPGRPKRALARQPVPPLMRNAPRGRAPAMPSLMRQVFNPQTPSSGAQFAMARQRKGKSRPDGFGGGSLIRSVFGKPGRKRRR